MAKNIILFLVVIAAVVGVGWALYSRNAEIAQGPGAIVSPSASPSASPVATGTVKTPSMTKLPNGLEMQDEVVGAGAEAKSGDTVSVHYTGTFTDGRKFDSSVDRGQPFSFLLGAGQVIQGWDIGVAGMRVGGKRKLIIPPALGYGAQGAGGVIPPNTTLVFEVELLAVQSK